jgi:hypothetical protein
MAENDKSCEAVGWQAGFCSVHSPQSSALIAYLLTLNTDTRHPEL